MALNGKKPLVKPSPARAEPDDAAFERVMSQAPDYKPSAPPPAGQGRAGKGREKGKGYAMGNKRQITHMITGQMLDEVDAEAERCGEARATVINRAIREYLQRIAASSGNGRQAS